MANSIKGGAPQRVYIVNASDLKGATGGGPEVDGKGRKGPGANK
jgi:hypothetical protein